jgi:lipopolysaccharide transport system ATP-binding protein
MYSEAIKMTDLHGSNSLQALTVDSDADQPEVLVSLQNVGKMYQLFDKPIDRLKYTLFWRLGKTYGREFWALHGVSFDVHRGEAVGILGRNGSGKSTLLQIIAGVLQPTEGEIKARGRISALLELGSGFNWEYSGRQNVYLSGAILGFSREQMEARFDDIAAFADIGEFMEQPVKLYSSGMFARLAFSVAIFVDPDILVVDEILAVGDYEFQQKCAARMRQMRDNGLTLLYVSHSTDTVKDVCDRGLFLNDGQAMYWGTAEDASEQYLRFIREKKWEKLSGERQKQQLALADFTNSAANLRYGSGAARVTRVDITDENDQPANEFGLGDTIHIHVYFKALVDVQHFSVSFSIRDNNGISVMGSSTFDERIILPDLKSGDSGKVVLSFKNQLRHGNYGVNLSLNSVSDREYRDNIELDWLGNAATFQVRHNPQRPIWYKFYCPIDVQVEIDS